MEHSIKNAIGGKQNFSLVELQEKTGMGLSDLLPCVEQMVLNGEATLSVSINAESCYVIGPATNACMPTSLIWSLSILWITETWISTHPGYASPAIICTLS